MAHPYQCLLYLSRSEKSVSRILVAATGSFLHVFDVFTGQIISSWSSEEKNDSSSYKDGDPNFDETEHNGVDYPDEILQPPSKRIRRSPGPIVSTESSSTEIVVEEGGSRRAQHLNPIIKLAATSSGNHIVAVTSEDKCLRVFDLSGDGVISQISERVMPKRPCAVIMSPDDLRILCADKFGDVYSLPLMGKPYEPKGISGSSETGLAINMIKGGPRKFMPSATSLTVHTKRNLNALKQQQDFHHEKPEKKSLAFDHNLILGHVSLLTDIVCASIPSKSREYIITADRDEHIRVSRGIPQAHIIEGYCLGHTEFVSKLCLLSSMPTILISGGGDSFLVVWDWAAGTIKQRIDLSEAVQEFKKLNSVENNLQKTETNTQIALSNLQSLEIAGASAGEKQTELLVTCEGIPALFIFTLDAHDRFTFRETYSLEGNVIDVVVLPDRSSIICSMDNIHKRFSTLEEDPASASRPLVDAIHFSQASKHWEKDCQLFDALLPALEKCAKPWAAMPQNSGAKGKSLKELLYGLASLRKHEVGADVGTDAAPELEDVS